MITESRNHTHAIQVMVASQVDLSVSKISLSQPGGTNAPLDQDGNPILGTITPSTANPAPKVPAVQAEAQVTVNMNGVPSGTTATDLQLMLGGQVIADQPIDISQFQQGDNVVKVDFTPPTDPSLLGVLPLTATVNASQAVQETDYTNNSFNTSPKAPPKTFDASGFVANLIALVNQSQTQGWIDNAGIVNSLLAKLNAAQSALPSDTKTAKNNLSAFMNAVSTQNGKHLTAEAYALLYFNAQYAVNHM